MGRLAPAYLFVQGSMVLGWWALLLTHAESRSWFFPGGDLTVELRAFLLPDALVLGAASIAAAWGHHARRSWARALTWVVAGGALYAALFTLHWGLLSAVPALSPALMTVLAAGSVICARQPV